MLASRSSPVLHAAWASKLPNSCLNKQIIIKYLSIREVFYLNKTMKTGIEYIGSRQKRLLDIAVGTAMLPAATIAQTALIASNGFRDNRLMTQERARPDGMLFDLYKSRTLTESDSNDVVPINALAKMMRPNGFDEFPQAFNILNGSMSAVGPRPIIASERAQVREQVPIELLEEHDAIVGCAKPGVFNTFGWMSHMNLIPEADRAIARINLDIMDAREGSLQYDLQLISKIARSVLKHELTNGSIRPLTVEKVLRGDAA